MVTPVLIRRQPRPTRVIGIGRSCRPLTSSEFCNDIGQNRKSASTKKGRRDACPAQKVTEINDAPR